MAIEQIEAFKYRGMVFTSYEKAVDHAESLVSDLIKSAMLERGFTISEWVKVSEIILANRKQIIELLDY